MVWCVFGLASLVLGGLGDEERGGNTNNNVREFKKRNKIYDKILSYIRSTSKDSI